jgi:cytochrome c oxidase subunit II
MIRRLPWRLMAGLALIGVLLTLTGCIPDAPQSTIHQYGGNNRRIWDIYNILWIGAAVVGALVEGLLIFAVIRYRGKPRTAHGRPVPVHGNTRLEIAWTIIPAIVLVVISIPSLRIIADLDKGPSDNPLHVTAVGHQFFFQFYYDDLGNTAAGVPIVSSGELHIPAGRQVDINLQSEDVIHSLWVPSLAGKTDLIPGRTNHMWLSADNPGTYSGECAEFCGLGHANMRFKVIAHSDADFNAWVDSQKNPQQGGNADAGQAFFLNGPCAGCHTIAGTTAKGSVGPELTHIGDPTAIPKIAGVLDNTEDNLKKWISDPPAVKPGTIMPNLHLSQSDLDNVVAYLITLK